MVFAISVLIVLGAVAWFRVAPSNPEQWHVSSKTDQIGDYPRRDGFMTVRHVGENASDVMADLDEVVRATPRTTVLAGSLGEGMITYVTRSRVFGFPDYTTVVLMGETLQINGRLRFGQSDLGVNRRRIDGWIAEISGFSGP